LLHASPSRQLTRVHACTGRQIIAGLRKRLQEFSSNARTTTPLQAKCIIEQDRSTADVLVEVRARKHPDRILADVSTAGREFRLGEPAFLLQFSG
jgi:hypothetical protein